MLVTTLNQCLKLANLSGCLGQYVTFVVNVCTHMLDDVGCKRVYHVPEVCFVVIRIHLQRKGPCLPALFLINASVQLLVVIMADVVKLHSFSSPSLEKVLVELCDMHNLFNKTINSLANWDG